MGSDRSGVIVVERHRLLRIRVGVLVGVLIFSSGFSTGITSSLKLFRIKEKLSTKLRILLPQGRHTNCDRVGKFIKTSPMSLHSSANNTPTLSFRRDGLKIFSVEVLEFPNYILKFFLQIRQLAYTRFIVDFF